MKNYIIYLKPMNKESMREGILKRQKSEHYKSKEISRIKAIRKENKNRKGEDWMNQPKTKIELLKIWITWPTIKVGVNQNRKKFNYKKIQCYNWNKVRHFAWMLKLKRRKRKIQWWDKHSLWWFDQTKNHTQYLWRKVMYVICEVQVLN